MFRETFKYGDALFCIPNFYENILKYDINSNNISYFSLGYSTEYLRKEGGVPSACSINQYVYILVYDSIIIFDMQLCDIVAVKKISNSRLTSIDVTQKNIFVFDASRCSLSVLDRVSLKKLKEIKFDCRSVKITCVYNGIVIVEDVIKAVRWFIDEQLNVICKEEYGSWLMENKASLYFSKWIKTKDRICEITPENHIILHNSNGKKECYNTDGTELFREKVKEYIIKCNNTSDVINEVFSENDILELPFFLDTLLCL